MDKNCCNLIKSNYSPLEVDVTYITLKNWISYMEENNYENIDKHLFKIIRKQFNRICIIRKQMIIELRNKDE